MAVVYGQERRSRLMVKGVLKDSRHANSEMGMGGGRNGSVKLPGFKQENPQLLVVAKVCLSRGKPKKESVKSKKGGVK